MTASFISGLAIGFIIFNKELGIPGWLKGGIVGLVLSLTDAIITKKYPPILGLGTHKKGSPVIGGLEAFLCLN